MRQLFLFWNRNPYLCAVIFSVSYAKSISYSPIRFLLPLAEVPNHVPASEPVSVASTPETDEIDQLFDDMQLDGIVSYTAFRQAVTGYQQNRAEKQVHHDPDRFFKTIYREAPVTCSI